MKKSILFILVMALFLATYGQTSQKRVIPANKRNYEVKKPFRKAIDATENFLKTKANPTVKSTLTPVEEEIGQTRYDLQTNQSTQNRLVYFPDGTIAAAWTMGFADAAFADRGTGYNYYDGSTWGAEPTVRIESIRTGWPSLVPWGSNGEAVIAHDFNAPGGIILSKRATKGSGNWTQSSIPGPAGQNGLSWPRMVSNGADHNNFHMFGLTRPVANSGTLYQGMDGALLYSRSTDGGATWDIANQILPGMTSSEYLGFGGDSYAFAEPKGNTLAFVVGDNWTDLFLMKSVDNGTTWTKTVIFQHPYPMFEEAHTLVLDTPTVCDGAISVALDNSGKAHVFFGLMRVLNADTTDGNTSFFPYTDGLAYWNEDLPPFSTLDYDTLGSQDHLVGWTQDLNGNDTIFEFVAAPALYYLSVTSMPNAMVDPDGNIILLFTSVMEHLDNGNQNYRHVWGRALASGSTTWSPFLDVTGGIIHNFSECVFPNIAPTSNNIVRFIYQSDEEPGLAVRGDADPYGDNKIVFSSFSRDEIVGISPESKPVFSISTPYPNPNQGNAAFELNLNQNSRVDIQINNLLGQKVFSQEFGNLNNGKHVLNINCNHLTPGIYVYTVKAGTQTSCGKMMIQ